MPLTAIMAAGSLALSGVSVLSEYQQGQFANRVGRAEATQLNQQAKEAQQTAGQQIIASDYKAGHTLSRIVAISGASGIVSSEGSTKEAIQSSAEEAELNDMYTKYAANVQSSGLQEQAILTETQGQQTESAADIGAAGGLISGGIESYGIYSGKVNPFFNFLPGGII